VKTARKNATSKRNFEPGPVVVVGSRDKPEVAKALDQFHDRLQRDFGIAAIDLDGTLDLSKVDARWLLLFGGDGAMLGAARRMGDAQIPTLAVNFGRLGFLTEVEFKTLDQALDRIAAGKVYVRERQRLSTEMGDWRYNALNDVVAHSALRGRLFRISAAIEGREALRYAGDGVIVSTPTGSTAYSLAAGGPILDPELEAIVITPLAAHALSQRPLVISADQTVELYIKEDDPPGRITLDGQVQRDFDASHRLKVRKAENPFLLIRVGLRSHYTRLRRILGWGGRPKGSA